MTHSVFRSPSIFPLFISLFLLRFNHFPLISLPIICSLPLFPFLFMSRFHPIFAYHVHAVYRNQEFSAFLWSTKVDVGLQQHFLFLLFIPFFLSLLCRGTKHQIRLFLVFISILFLPEIGFDGLVSMPPC